MGRTEFIQKKNKTFFFNLIPFFSVAIDLIVQHLRDFLSDRVSEMTLSPTTTPALNTTTTINGSRGGKKFRFSGDPKRPH